MNNDDTSASRGTEIPAELGVANGVQPAGAAASLSHAMSRTPAAQAGGPDTFRTHDPISSWLDILERLLPGRDTDRRAMRDEIEDHLRARTHDLMIEGKSERQAVAIAVAELGDAADVAHRFAASDTARTRRKLMNIGAVAFCGIALATGIAAFQMEPGPARVSVYESTRESAVAATITASSEIDTNWLKFFDEAAKSANLKAQVHWSQINAVIPNDEVRLDNPLPIHFRSLPLADALDLLNDALNVPSESGIDFRVRRDMLVISTVRHFDQQEMTLATYDLSEILNTMSARLLEQQAAPVPVPFGVGGGMMIPRPDPMMIDNWRTNTMARISQLVTSLVHPDQWRSNEAVATVNSFGSKLFINAPARFHPQIEWVLDEVRRDAINAAVRDEEAARAAASPVASQAVAEGIGAAVGASSRAGGVAPGSAIGGGTTLTAEARLEAPTVDSRAVGGRSLAPAAATTAAPAGSSIDAPNTTQAPTTAAGAPKAPDSK